MSYLTGVGLTAYGKLPDRSTLDLMIEAASAALADAQLERKDIDGLLCGYSTTFPHLMLSTVFAEHFGLTPDYAQEILMGGATGFGMAMLADPQRPSSRAAGACARRLPVARPRHGTCLCPRRVSPVTRTGRRTSECSVR